MPDAPILGGIHRPEDLTTADDFTKKHTPFVSCERTGESCEVFVEVGHAVSHPNTPDHFIEWIELRVGDATVARFDFSAVVTQPSIKCRLNLEPSTEIVAYASCNLHGVWAAGITV
ncbi:MAG: superoxide reductase [Coriobacteriia bacterium]|nr:superoxide reductase [Coriobacteriia bacterium]